MNENNKRDGFFASSGDVEVKCLLWVLGVGVRKVEVRGVFWKRSLPPSLLSMNVRECGDGEKCRD